MGSIALTQPSVKEEMGLCRVPIKYNERYKPSGTKSYVNLMARYGFQPTQPGPYGYINRMFQRGLAGSTVALGGRAHMEKVLARKSEVEGGYGGQVTADDIQNESLYLCEVKIGTPAQKLELQLDTASSDIWVFSSGSSRGVNRTNFDAWKSSSFSCQSDKTWVMKRPDGSSISGEVGTDTVVVGGLEVPDQLLGLGKVVGGTSTERMVADGTLGLSMPQTRYIQRNGVNDPQTSFVARMAEAKILPEDAQLFTTALCRPTQAGKQESFCTFGYVDEDMVDGEISWAKVDSGKGMWMFPSASTTINDDKISRSGNMAVVDSSTPLILLSDEACEAFYKKIEGAKYSRLHQGWLVPGGETQGMPELRVAVGETEFGISTSEYAFSPADGDMFFGVVQSRGNNEFDVLGVPFLRSVYAIWDFGHQRFGCIARSK
ncbi:hypothetical protein MCOR27_001233 [Pyricularia oryzae]|uniref:Peptidase A1 domain-containing protein n=2 Tax=Pyricularia TaxID=48558 RepID=A0ABQ8NGV8_PYRGI|nr:hypothetical protein MCOR01_007072 [Pyricularia oryzae]KAI6296869.1 hypothetical protein MCOR33_006670 [Pyricularia grisea]KAH9434352.1 hypothetical protein MCOR02_006364 [Pyricularia oryzae]KAI6257001.1 hypothetical protein MCOR19_006580 [Pyricularia oryzae]KAI6273421.1 hypothetical protein MCOR26_006895 [Pyricularia oryzae]